MRILFKDSDKVWGRIAIAEVPLNLSREAIFLDLEGPGAPCFLFLYFCYNRDSLTAIYDKLTFMKIANGKKAYTLSQQDT